MKAHYANPQTLVVMSNTKNIPSEVKLRLEHFESQVKEQFSFLRSFGYSLEQIDNGQTENFKDYFSDFTFKNDLTVIKIHFSTDIIKGIKTAFQNLSDAELPVVDSQITCSIWDKNAFMSIHSYIEAKFPEIPMDNFRIDLNSPNLETEISKVTQNYSEFFKTNLTSVLERKTIYDCYTDRFYDKVFKEIHYH